MEDETELDNALLLDAAFQIIDASLDTKALFQEACQLSRKLQEESVEVSMSDLLSVTCMEMQESKHGVSHKSMISTPALAKEVIRLTQQSSENQSPLCPKDVKKDWSLILELIKESIQQSVFLPGLFSSWISKRGLKLEFMWDLHKIGAYNLYSHLALCLKETPYQTNLSQTLIAMCEHRSDDIVQQQNQILTGVTNLLINNSFMENQGPSTKDSKMYLTVLDRLLEGIIHLSGSSGQGHISPFSNLNNESISKPALKKFARHALSYFLQHQADFKVSERIPSVTEHKPKEYDKFLIDCLKQLMDCLSAQEVVDVLNQSVKCDLVNSRTITAFLAAFLFMSERSGKIIADYVKTSLSTGLQESDISHTTTAFYIARQCCSLNSVQFPSYRDWYQQTLGEASTSLANSRPSFAFLVKCLTTWTPEEAPEYLKAHILRRPYVPPKMRDVYESYVMLAKTRLDDMKIPLRDVACSDSSSSTDSIQTMKQQAAQMQQDVDNCTKAFEENGKISTSILEASIFRKPYFVGKFLPAILKPRCLPDKPDSKMRLIEELRKSGRIPSAMYTTYQEGCEKEKKNLLEGVFELDDDGDEEMLLSPLEQLQFRLDRLKEPVGLGDDKKVSECIALVEERIHALIAQSKAEEQEPDSIEIVFNQSIDTIQEQIITKILCCLSNCLDYVQVDYKSTTPQSFHWFDSFIAIVIRCPLLKAALIKYILICLDKKAMSESLSPECLSAACVGVTSKCHQLSLRITDKDGIVQEWKNLVDACDYFLLCSCEDDISFTLNFLLAYLFHAKNRLDRNKFHLENSDIIEIPVNQLTETQLLPTFMIKKISLLCWRCGLMRSYCNNLGTLNQSSILDLQQRLHKYIHLLSSDFWNHLNSANEPSLKEWILFELRFDPSRDILSKRQRLSYFWNTAGKFIQELSIVSVCSQLFHLLAATATSFQRKDICQSKGDSCGDFLSLLKGLLLQLPACDVKSPWLVSTLTSCHDKNLQSTLLSLSLHLHPHLLLSNQRRSLMTKHVALKALSLLDLFADSSLNEGGYFSLDVFIFVNQACDCFHDAPDMLTFLCHPALFTSVGIHQESLIQLGIFASFPDAFKSCINSAENWAKRLIGAKEKGKSSDEENNEDWMKASALFSWIIKGGTSNSGADLICKIPIHQAKCLSYLWELITVWFVHNMEHLDKLSILQEVYHTIAVRHPHVVINSLDESTSHQREFRKRIGWQPDARHIHIFCILRQCSQIATRDLVNVCETLMAPLITAYSTLLETAHIELDIYNTISMSDLGSISSWLQEVVNSCQSSSLNSINLSCLYTSDPLLYRAICLKNHKS